MTTDRLAEVLDDLAAEGRWLDALLGDVPDDRTWLAPTPADGWDVRTTVAHLAWTDAVAVVAATDAAGWERLVLEALDDPDGYVDAQALVWAGRPRTELVTRWRAGRERLPEVLRQVPAGEKIPWFGPPMSPTSMATARYMETWAHGLDVADALGVPVVPHDRVRHVVHLGARTRGFAFAARGLPVPEAPVRVVLTLPGGGTWTDGDERAEDRVTGPAWDFARLVTQRAHRADLDLVSTGETADRWLDVAQAFAGPPGTGRPPSSALPGTGRPSSPPRETPGGQG